MSMTPNAYFSFLTHTTQFLSVKFFDSIGGMCDEQMGRDEWKGNRHIG